MNTINETTLRANGASAIAIAKFRQHYPEGVAIIVAPGDAAHVAKMVGASWLASRLLNAEYRDTFSRLLIKKLDRFDMIRMCALVDRNIGVQTSTAYEANRASTRYAAQLADAFAELQDGLADCFGELYCAQLAEL